MDISPENSCGYTDIFTAYGNWKWNMTSDNDTITTHRTWSTTDSVNGCLLRWQQLVQQSLSCRQYLQQNYPCTVLHSSNSHYLTLLQTEYLVKGKVTKTSSRLSKACNHKQFGIFGETFGVTPVRRRVQRITLTLLTLNLTLPTLPYLPQAYLNIWPKISTLRAWQLSPFPSHKTAVDWSDHTVSSPHIVVSFDFYS